MNKVVYSCVLAEKPKFAVQVLIWAWSLIDRANVSADQIVVHALDGSNQVAIRSLRALGVTVVGFAPFHDKHPYCNKLRQLESRILQDADVCVLCDTDIVFTQPFERHIRPDVIRAKVVDLPNPPMPVWEQIIEKSGLRSPERTITSFGEHPTPTINFNGGLYIIPAVYFRVLSDAWPRWARWLMDHPELLSDQYRKHIDQVSFGLACLEKALPVESLELTENYPTHTSVHPKPDIAPSVIHYHSHVNPSHFLLPVGLPNVDAQIERINDVIRKRRRTEFNNQVFWDFRYAEFPALGSGVGSREKSLQLKKTCLSQLNSDLQPLSVLDIGCGDLEVAKSVDFANYTGLDLSEQALHVAKRKRPEWFFIEGNPLDIELETSELVLCFDVLIHQPTFIAYIALIGRLLSLTGRNLVLSGYNQKPWHSSEITFYYEPISTTIQRLAPTAEIEIVAGYRDTTVVNVSINDPTPYCQRLFDTRFGAIWSKPDDLISKQFLEYEGHTRNELAMLLSMLDPGDCVVDVGAHIGSFSVPIAKTVGKAGRVICVEPEPLNQARLSQNLIINQCNRQAELFGGAIGPQSKDHYASDEGNTEARFLRPGSKNSSVEAVTLDSLCSGASPSLIKIDVEGMELAVLKTGENTIELHRPLLYLEVSADQLRRAGDSAISMDDWLKERNYRLFRNTGPRNSKNDDFVIEEIDSLLLNESLFDCLAVPDERVEGLVSKGKLPQDALYDSRSDD
ncbi:class I SAM-dependent methyltransferase [Gilvimarinus sp. SDUM040013]|uniref:Class I SAM-dependent methyltransferase n=1 Tax=Gilvimarinus gilvus TaxID=3058038 RepID=A0ABU4RWK2_9GAMM|nr:class I SAM-dependent methyltransferase [Gilvimarinus sp. SDUM040013]MDO3387345.1 class I SAM-dependent methyltransferase [Gilvimarinus sp. SDUM040013]MDX6849034.1 class I SAM-dependent methyltransferase [Gilvimarinus sp. SDUM040013]